MIKFIIIECLIMARERKKSTQSTNDGWQTCHYPPAVG